jgi:succinoglycan biosynthesis protein ExoL
MYEGSFYGAVPIAFAGVETGRWLAKRSAGVLFGEPFESQIFESQLVEFFRGLDRDRFRALAHGVEALPRKDLVIDRAECRDLVEALCRSSADHPRSFPAATTVERTHK